MKLRCAIGAAMLAWADVTSAQTGASAIEQRGVATIQDAIAALEQDGAAPPTPEGNIGEWFGPAAYPPDARRAGEQGRVVARLAVSAAGRVSGCAVEASSGSVSLDRRTCEIAQTKLTFRAPHDGRGRALASSYRLPVRWVLPEPVQLLARTSLDETVRLDVSADDRLLGCRFTSNDPATSGAQEPCTMLKDISPSRLRAFKGPLGDRHAVVTIQRLIQFAGQPPLAEVRATGGQTLVRLQRVAFEVAPDGAKVNVRTTEQIGTAVSMPDPSAPLAGFEAAPGRTDKVQVSGIISVAVAP